MRIIATVILLVFVIFARASAAITGFEYTGGVIRVGTDRYKLGLTTDTPVSGRVLYDNERPATERAICTFGTCTGYRQHLPDGMAAKLGSLIITADDYVVEVRDNVENNGVFDALYFNARPYDYSPTLPTLPKVDGEPTIDAWYQFSITGSKDMFSDTSLPPAVDASQFSPYFGIFDASPDGALDVIFKLWSISPIAALGDYDRDHEVSEKDYEYWRSTGTPEVLGADGNGNHVVDAADYVVWRTRQSVDSRATAVPEPYALQAVATLLFSWIARRNRLHGSGGRR